MPQETRQERLRRRYRTAIVEAEELLERYLQLVLHQSRRTYRLNPVYPDALYVRGMAHGARQCYELAIKHMDKAHNIVHRLTGPHDDKTFECTSTFAMQAGHFCAYMRLEFTSELEREPSQKKCCTGRPSRRSPIQMKPPS